MAPRSTTTPALRIAVAQTTPRSDPSDADAFAAAGEEVRALMRTAAARGARLVHFPEGTLCFPSKTALSPDPVVLRESDWSRYAWDAQDDELDAVRALAAELGVWVVIGAPHRAADRRDRPTLSLHAIDPTGERSVRYDERLLSRTKRDLMYRAGERGVLIDVDGVRLGLVSGLEGLFPELFADYEDAGADAVLYSTAGPGDPDAADSLAAAARSASHLYGLGIGYAAPCDNAPIAGAGLLLPPGVWAARADRAEPAVVVGELTARQEDPGRE